MKTVQPKATGSNRLVTHHGNQAIKLKMDTQTIVNVNETKYPDSIEFGTPSTGCWKCYYNASNPAEAKERMDNALALFAEAQLKNAQLRK